jgi:hypothetical protein
MGMYYVEVEWEHRKMDRLYGIIAHTIDIEYHSLDDLTDKEKKDFHCFC